jgi:hypothetical protein
MKSLEYWTPNGFEISSYKFHLSNKINNVFSYTGFDTTGKCIYAYNSLGFRGDEPDASGFKVMSIGCSLTEGVGVNNQETWPAQFSKFIPNGINNNFGLSGRSNDYICRCLLSYYDLIKPNLVLIMYTSPQRREIYTNEGGIESYMSTGARAYFQHTNQGVEIHKNLLSLQNDNEDFINWYKNHLLIKNFLEFKNCNWLWNGNFGIPIEYDEFNRFDGEYMNFIDIGRDDVHPGPIHNTNYSMKLYNYIYKYFRSYLPENAQPIKTVLI